MNDAPQGTKFSLNYLKRGGPLRDSQRFRTRALHAFNSARVDSIVTRQLIEGEVGAKVPTSSGSPYWGKFFDQAELRDLLDTITVVYGALAKRGYVASATKWREDLRRIIAEENLGYRLDDSAGVHLGVDDEFEHNRAATIGAMNHSRYDAARSAFEAAHAALDVSPPQSRLAIKHTFEALETVFRLILGDQVSRLGAAEIERKLKPLALISATGQARDALNLMTKAFADWVNAAHQFRHARGVESEEDVPASLAILMVSSGASFLRWLVALDPLG